MAAIPPFDLTTLQAICDVLGDTGGGLTGTEMGTLLQRCGIPDPMAGMTKRHRLFEALKAKQGADGVGNHVVGFIQEAMAPVRYTSNRDSFAWRREELNKVLAFAGLTLGEDGKAQRADHATTLTEAERRAGRLRHELLQRRVHGDVLKACRSELVQENYFHAVLEATKSVAERVRSLGGLATDGAQLVDEAFGRSKGLPILAFNSLQTESELNEHSGLMNLMKGMFSAFRNPTAHVPRHRWPISEEEALDLFCLVSLIHKRLDKAVKTPRPPAT